MHKVKLPLVLGLGAGALLLVWFGRKQMQQTLAFRQQAIFRAQQAAQQSWRSQSDARMASKAAWGAECAQKYGANAINCMQTIS